LCSFLCSPYTVIRRFCLLLLAALTKYPVALKAVLRAEIALLSQFLAVWTLQRACFLVAIFTRALARGVSGHDGRDLRLLVAV
jgi:hypothetical protein